MTIEYAIVFLPGVRNGKNHDKPIVYHAKYTHLISSLCGKHPTNHNFIEVIEKNDNDICCPRCLKILNKRKKYLNLNKKCAYN